METGLKFARAANLNNRNTYDINCENIDIDTDFICLFFQRGSFSLLNLKTDEKAKNEKIEKARNILSC